VKKSIYLADYFLCGVFTLIIAFSMVFKPIPLPLPKNGKG